MDYDSTTGKYRGTSSDGRPVVVDGDVWAENRADQLRSAFDVWAQDATDEQWATVEQEMADPDGWVDSDDNEARGTPR